jgi:hypothetical protein
MSEAPTDAEVIDQVMACVPDDIDIFRMLRRAGRRDVDKAKAIDDALHPIRRGLAMLRHNSEQGASA